MDLSPIDPNENTAAEEPRELCSNCGKKMAKKGKFCPHCGQKRFEGRIPLKSLTKKFFYKLTNLDSQLLRMMWRLFIPARVSLDYFAGKIKQYPHPFQFFFVVMFFFLLMFNKITDNGTKGLHLNFVSTDTTIPLNERDSTKKGSNAKKPKSAKPNLEFGGNTKQASSAKQADFYFLLERYVFSHQIQKAFDSLPPRLQTPAVNESLDIILEKTNGHWTKQLDSLLSKDSLSITFGSRVIRIAHQDIVEYSPEELTELYGVTDWFSKTLLRQGVRSIQKPSDLINAYIGSFSWTVLALIIIMAGVMHLFYWRQKRYYVEHFVVLLHWHSGVLLALTFLMGLDYYFPLGTWWSAIGIGIFVFFFLTIKRFYGQNWFKTSLKCICFSFLYSLGFSILFVLGLLVVFTFF
ncbi:DUF3667 domain-containing protein [Haliscomenobacter sp.]|uniref:DUF3667 domain-containing protein n=1 Tax=Haliscomenobacter sp. TaxID=2717303 RepID=UPI0035945C17